MSTVKRFAMTRFFDWSPGMGGVEVVLASDYDALSAQLAEARAELAKVVREVREWVCESCNMCYPGPPQHGLRCVICPKCGGSTMPHETHQRRRAETERDEARAELLKFQKAFIGARDDRDALRAAIESLRSALLDVRESDSLESAWSVCTAALRSIPLPAAAQGSAPEYDAECRSIDEALSGRKMPADYRGERSAAAEPNLDALLGAFGGGFDFVKKPESWDQQCMKCGTKWTANELLPCPKCSERSAGAEPKP